MIDSGGSLRVESILAMTRSAAPSASSSCETGEGLHERGVEEQRYLGHLEVDGLELLAVAAPGGVELDEHVLGVVDDKRLERVSGNNLDGLRQMIWRVSLALDVHLQRCDSDAEVAGTGGVGQGATLSDPDSCCLRKSLRSAVVMSPLAPVNLYLSAAAMRNKGRGARSVRGERRYLSIWSLRTTR